jgi:molybdate transport system ATP-binding protein
MIELDIRLALSSYTLAVRADLSASVTAVLGPSGSGKTSLLEVIAGLRSGATGRVRVSGESFLDTPRGIALAPEERRVGYVPQHPALFPHLDVRANIRYGVRRRDPRPALFEQTVDLLDIRPLLARRAHELSGGEAQRIALARALMTNPRLLLLDEPLASLDTALQLRILPYLIRVRDDARVPILYVTHRPGEALALASEALALSRGTVEAHGPISDVLPGRRIAALREDDTLDNLVQGVFVEPGLLRIGDGGGTIAVPGESAQRRDEVGHYRVGSEEILLFRARPQGISARNVFAARVLEVEWRAADAFVRLQGLGREWRARITAVAARELEIRPGAELWVAIKTHGLTRL